MARRPRRGNIIQTGLAILAREYVSSDTAPEIFGNGELTELLSAIVADSCGHPNQPALLKSANRRGQTFGHDYLVLGKDCVREADA